MNVFINIILLIKEKKERQQKLLLCTFNRKNTQTNLIVVLH